MRTLRTLLVPAACALVLVPIAAARTSTPSLLRARHPPTGGWPEQAGGAGAAAGHYDGIEMHWEYPGSAPSNGADHSRADKHNATLLFQEFRRQADAYAATTGKHYLLTADLP